LRARVVVPVAQPPIANGAVVLDGARIGAVGPWPELRAHWTGPWADLGEGALLPGLVNAHCHLDYTGLAGQLPPQPCFPDWIKSILERKRACALEDFRRAWLAGAAMLLRAGVTTVADVETAPELLPGVWSATPLRVFSFLEMTGVRSRREPALVLQEAVDKAASLPAGRCGAGLSPHAPYSTTAELLRRSAEAARARGWRLTVHVAESREEFEMFTRACGPMFDWLRRNERDMSDCGHGSPVQHLARCGILGENLLAAHANYLAPGDAQLLGRHGVSVVHCPRSHAFFKHEPFPLAELHRARVNLCLGTDSLATVCVGNSPGLELSMFAEMRALSAASPDLGAEAILRMATVNGARALGRSEQLGVISPGLAADLILIPFGGPPAGVYDAAVHYQGHVTAAMISGQWALAPGVASGE
jgi:cytosine/adenosine deaminase-related metal-dependent hydrolase